METVVRRAPAPIQLPATFDEIGDVLVVQLKPPTTPGDVTRRRVDVHPTLLAATEEPDQLGPLCRVMPTNTCRPAAADPCPAERRALLGEGIGREAVDDLTVRRLGLSQTAWCTKC